MLRQLALRNALRLWPGQLHGAAELGNLRTRGKQDGWIGKELLGDGSGDFGDGAGDSRQVNARSQLRFVQDFDAGDRGIVLDRLEGKIQFALGGLQVIEGLGKDVQAVGFLVDVKIVQQRFAIAHDAERGGSPVPPTPEACGPK